MTERTLLTCVVAFLEILCLHVTRYIVVICVQVLIAIIMYTFQASNLRIKKIIG